MGGEQGQGSTPHGAQPQGRRRARKAEGPALSDPRRLTAAGVGASAVLRQSALLIRKDLLTEWRTKETLLTLIFFALLLVVIFSFSLWVDEKIARAVAPGIIWIALAFTGALAIERSFAQEQEGDTLTALALVPGAQQALFAAKTATNILYILIVVLVVAPLVLLMLSVPLPMDTWPCFAAALVAGTVGFSAVGTVFSAMLVAVRRRGVLLPIVLYPIALPLLIMGVEAVGVLIQEFPVAQAWSWVKVMVAVDVLYIVGGAWLFGHIGQDE